MREVASDDSVVACDDARESSFLGYLKVGSFIWLPQMVVNYPKIPRAPWNDIPDTLLVAEEGPVRAHSAYQQAKTGDVAAAKTLAADFVGPPALDALLRLVGEQGIILVPVHAIEDQGINRIPAAFAELLASRLGLSVVAGIVQGNVVSHTGATGWQRMADLPYLTGR